MSKKILVIFTMLVLTLLLSTIANAQNLVQNPKILVIDETKSMELSLRIQGFVHELKSREAVDVTGKISKVQHPTQNPLQETQEANQQKYDLVIIIPHTIETGRINQIWIVTRPFTTIPLKMREQAEQMLDELKKGINKAFSGIATAVDVNDDVIPAYFSTLFQKQGVFR